MSTNPLERIIQDRRYIIFDRGKSYSKLMEVLEVFGNSNMEKLKNLGIVDAVFGGY